jgi:methylmalonyl-CoA carboxyltransferase large subunit
MMLEATNVNDLCAALTEVRSELQLLSARLARLESAQPAIDATKGPAVPQPIAAPVVPEAISEELMLVISAAVAAFLGERAHIRQVHIVRSSGWSNVGRVFIQASHILNK